MENVELVIKLPKDVFKKTVFYREFRDLNDCITTIKALENAVLLPKGHGRLIYAKDVGEYLTLADVPTIIEADTESEE